MLAWVAQLAWRSFTHLAGGTQSTRAEMGWAGKYLSSSFVFLPLPPYPVQRPIWQHYQASLPFLDSGGEKVMRRNGFPNPDLSGKISVKFRLMTFELSRLTFKQRSNDQSWVTLCRSDKCSAIHMASFIKMRLPVSWRKKSEVIRMFPSQLGVAKGRLLVQPCRRQVFYQVFSNFPRSSIV